VIEHVPDYLFLLSEFERVLVKGGELFITSYDKYFILHSILNDPTHVIEWNMDEFKTLIENKFEVKNYFKYGSFFNYRMINRLIVKVLKPELCIFARKR